jgi:hypothetical protein
MLNNLTKQIYNSCILSRNIQILVSTNICFAYNMYMWDFYHGRCVKQKMGVYKKEREAFLYLEANLNSSFATLAILMVKINPRIAILLCYLNILSWDLS